MAAQHPFLSSTLLFLSEPFLLVTYRKRIVFINIDHFGQMPSARVVPFHVLVAIDLILDRRSMPFNKFHKHRRPLQHVDVITRSCHAKGRVSDPQVTIYHNFKHHTTLSSLPFVQPLPTKLTVLSTPLHVIDASKHLNKSSRCILFHDPSCLYFIWSFQIVWS